MSTLPEDVHALFNGVLDEISQDISKMMLGLWEEWSQLGIDDATKKSNISKLLKIYNDFHCEVRSESGQKLKVMRAEIEKLKEETEELSRCLSVDISIQEFQEGMLLYKYKSDLEEQICGYREQVELRRTKIKGLLEWQQDLVETLGVTMQELQQVPLPAEEELERLEEHLRQLQVERDKRAELFLHTQIEIKEIMAKLQMKPRNKFEHIVTTSQSVNFHMTDLNMDRLGKLRQDLMEIYEHTNNRVLELRERLTKLWECLEEDQIYRESFLQAHTGCHAEAEAAIREEIRRCDQVKRQKIQVFIANVRTKIKLMWDNCMYSERERDEFMHYYQDYYSEDTLTLHEFYLEKITSFYNEHKRIFDMVAMRRDLWSKMNELEARATEPGRYNNRGGQLLKEERERKAIASNLPKIEAQLREMVQAYEAQTGNTFTVEGRPLLQLIDDDWETRKMDRQNKLSARKRALTPNAALLRSQATSPAKRNRTAHPATPMPATAENRNAHPTTPMPATAEKNRLLKRQFITGSASNAVSSVASNHSALKRSAISTVKRRISGRLATRALPESAPAARRLDYGTAGVRSKTPKITVNGSILKHKRGSTGKRRSGGARRSMNATRGAAAAGDARHKDPLMETTLLTTYTDFKDNINEQQISRSSMATRQENKVPTINLCQTVEAKRDTPTPKKTSNMPLTPKVGKENLQHVQNMTPKQKNLMFTPARLTRSAVKLNHDHFATPRAPFSANKVNMQRQNSVSNMQVKTPDKLNRANTHTHLVRVKNLPPLI